MADTGASVAVGKGNRNILPMGYADLMGRILSRENMLMAHAHVQYNGGAAGSDGMTLKELPDWLVANWAGVKRQLLEGSYRPSPVRGVEIPKPGGGVRLLGIPTVLDRLIQHAVHQVLSPIWEAGFSPYSYGFRPGRSAHGALGQALAYINNGHQDVVDLDLKKSFDRVDHGKLMALVRAKVSDRALLRLTRRYLQSGIMIGGVFTPRGEGTPQGGPLSPLLSNILLDELDKELSERGHCFVRYADDVSIFLRSKPAANRVRTSITNWLQRKLHLGSQ